MLKENYFVLTGAMGAGKTTMLNKLKEKFICIVEPARGILKEQREINGVGVPEKNPVLFNELMLFKMITQYNENIDSSEIIIFDRGIPDIIAYSELLKTNSESSINAAKEYKFNKFAFMFNGWEDIYANDEERKVDFNTANNFGINLRRIYSDLGYVLIDVPFVSVEERAVFISDKIKNIIGMS